MKVAHVLLRFDAPGGVETNVREVTRRLRDAGEEVEVYASDLYDESSWERRSNYAPVVDGVPVHRFPVRKRLVPGLTMPMMVGLMDALSESGADVIHAHSHRYGHVLEAAAVADRLDIPLVVSTHYHPADRREPTWKRGLLRIQDTVFGMTAYRVARALVVQTDREAEMVGEFAPRKKLRTIAPGIDLSSWTIPEADRPEGVDLPDQYFLFVGRLASNKGLPTLLDALAALEPRSRIPLVLMGRDWGARPALEAQARALGIADQLRFLEFVARPSSYRAVVRRARALVLPSEFEAFGLVLLEAMAAGTPIVATAVGGVPDVLDDGRSGRLVPYGDSVALARALRSVTEDAGETERLRSVASRRVQGFDWSVTVDRHRALYRELLNR
ncbi:MAG TPA: glycosyltransferase family 4 protein [Thermoplasmata archaeon]|nr:glycosyltransferase family 4 protein [Thermoplasmata archaeon]